jgi:hypothetical protein
MVKKEFGFLQTDVAKNTKSNQFFSIREKIIKRKLNLFLVRGEVIFKRPTAPSIQIIQENKSGMFLFAHPFFQFKGTGQNFVAIEVNQLMGFHEIVEAFSIEQHLVQLKHVFFLDFRIAKILTVQYQQVAI